MKKILTMGLALAMLLGCVAVFASCGPRPKMDLEDAKDALEDVYKKVAFFAEKEGLSAHGRSARIRFEEI